MNTALRAIIIDDEPDGVKALSLIIQKFIPDLKVVALTTNALEGIDFINNYQPEVVFLDINMPLLDGFELLENIQFKKFNLIFTTAHSEYGLKALKNGAIDYLLKPINIGELKQAVERVKKKQQELTPQINVNALLDLIAIEKFKVPIPTKTSIEYVFTKDLVCIEADTHHSKVSLANVNGEIIAIKSLKEYDELLCKPDSIFIRIHNSFIININFVFKYLKENGGYVVMQNSKKIPVSKYKKAELLKAINLFSEDV